MPGAVKAVTKLFSGATAIPTIGSENPCQEQTEVVRAFAFTDDRVMPYCPDDDTEAYMAAGRATIAHCDLLIAVWDGRPPRGRGGTAEVVHLAVAQGTPVIHIPSDGAQAMGLLWSGFDPNVVTRSGDDRGVRQPFEDARAVCVI